VYRLNEAHSSRSLVANAAWSLVGHVLPLSVAIVSVPMLIHALGNERFGILTLCWVVAGYFNVLDLGLGRSLILAFSRLDKSRDRDEVSKIFWAGSALLGGIGILTGGALYLGADKLPELLGVSSNLQAEASGAFRLVAFSLPATLLLPGLAAMPVAWQHQKALTLIRVPSGILSHLIPIIMLHWTNDLRQLLFANLILRIVILLAQSGLCWYVSNLGRVDSIRGAVRSLISDGSWMMLTNILAPLLMSMDRFVLSHTSGPSWLATYAPPLDLATKAWTLAGVGLAVMFPAMGHFLATNRKVANELYDNLLRIIVLWSPAVLLTMAGIGRFAIHYWIGAEYSRSGGILLAVFCIGIYWGLPGGISFSGVQASGHSKRAATIHLFEFPIYLGLLWVAANYGGIFGIAIVWSLRHACDSLAMYLVARRSGLEAAFSGTLVRRMLAGSSLLVVIAVLHAYSSWAGLAFALATCAIWLVFGWKSDPSTANSIKAKFL
jgi:O-antigen/teichoic acid export membrane protein